MTFNQHTLKKKVLFLYMEDGIQICTSYSGPGKSHKQVVWMTSQISGMAHKVWV